MNKGYRFSASVALYSYRADRVANFGVQNAFVRGIQNNISGATDIARGGLAGINGAGYSALGGAALGGVGGALSAGEDASWQDRLGKGALGAGVGAGAGYGAAKGVGYLRKPRNAGIAKAPAPLTPQELKYRQLVSEGTNPDTAREIAAGYNYKGNPNEDLSVYANLSRNYRKAANFAFPGQGLAQGAWNVIKGAGRYVDDAAQGIGKAYGQGIQNVGTGSLGVTNRLPPLRMPGAQTGDALGVAGTNIIDAGKSISKGGRYGKYARRALGYGTLGAGALGAGAAGYAGYNALTGN